MFNADFTIDAEKVKAAEVWLRYSDHPRDIILLEMYTAFKAVNFRRLRNQMTQLDTDINALKVQVQTNTDTETQLIQKLQTAVNSDDPADDAIVTSLISQLAANNTAMQNVLNPPASGATGTGTTGAGTGEGEAPATGADVVK